MKFRFRASALASLAACLSCLTLTGCGGGGDAAPVAAAPSSSSSSSPAPASASMSMPGGDGAVASDGAGEGAVQPGMEGPPGMGGMGGMGPMGGTTSDDNTMANMGMGGMSPGGMSPGGMSPGGMSPPGMESMGMGGMSSPMGMGGMTPGGMGGMGMGGMGGPAFEDPAPAEDADYLSKAKYAFAIGKESAAEPYVMAEMLANDNEAAALLQQIRWSPTLRKPALTLRFAVGVDLKAPSTITDYKPIGRTQFANRSGQGGGNGQEMMMGMPGGGGGGNQGTTAQKNLGQLTGRFGEDLIKSFESAWDSGTFGSVFSGIETIVPVTRPNQNNMNGMGGMMGMGGMPGGMDMSMGMAGSGMMPGGMGGEGTGNNAPTDAALRERATPGKVVVPGLTYLGTGNQAELIGKAEAEDIDYLFLFEVEVKASRQGVTNDTRLRLISTKDQASLGATSELSNNKVDREMALKGDNDDVAKQLTSLFRKVDTIKLVDMPKMKPENAQARIKGLIEKKTKDVLPILMEIKLYHSQGLLNDEERDAAYQLTILNGLAFANGTIEDREFVLKPLLPGYK